MDYLYEKSLATANCKSLDEKSMIDRLFTAVERMVEQKVPFMVDKYINEYKDKLIIDIETMINGKMVNSDSIVSAIQETVAKQLNT